MSTACKHCSSPCSRDSKVCWGCADEEGEGEQLPTVVLKALEAVVLQPSLERSVSETDSVFEAVSEEEKPSRKPILAPNSKPPQDCKMCGKKCRRELCFKCQQQENMVRKPPPSHIQVQVVKKGEDSWTTVARAKSSSKRASSQGGKCVTCGEKSQDVRCDKCKVIQRALQNGCTQDIAEQLAQEAQSPDKACATCTNMIPQALKYCAQCRKQYRNVPRPCKECGVVFIGGTYCKDCTESLRSDNKKCADCGRRTPVLGKQYCQTCISEFRKTVGTCPCGLPTNGGNVYCKACVIAYRKSKMQEL